MDPNRSTFSVRIYPSAAGGLQITVVRSDYPSQGHWQNTYATLIQSTWVPTESAPAAIVDALLDALNLAAPQTP